MSRAAKKRSRRSGAALPYFAAGRARTVVDIPPEVRTFWIHGVDEGRIQAERAREFQRVPRLEQVLVAFVKFFSGHLLTQVIHDEFALFDSSRSEQAFALTGSLADLHVAVERQRRRQREGWPRTIRKRARGGDAR